MEGKQNKFYESTLLQLNASKAKVLRWSAKLNLEETINFLVKWYKSYKIDRNSVYKISLKTFNDFKNNKKQR